MFAGGFADLSIVGHKVRLPDDLLAIHCSEVSIWGRRQACDPAWH